MVDDTGTQAPEAHPTRLQLFLALARISLSSFGGGLSGWLLRDIVESRRWMSHEDFLNGLAVAQALPGVNVTNMAIWIGFRLHGPLGAVIGFLGILLPSMTIVILLGIAFGSLAGLDPVQVALAGAAAASIGLPMSLGIVSAIHLRRTVLPILIMGLTFFAVVWLRIPLILVIIVLGTVSVAFEWVRLRRGQR